jgi:chromosome segregation ATPase
MLTPVLRAMKRRLERWELEHLREHSAELAERLEAAEQRVADAERRLTDAEYACDFWHDRAVDMHREAAEQSGGTRGITMDGRLVVVPAVSGGLHA